jgi:hypothetical protein
MLAFDERGAGYDREASAVSTRGRPLREDTGSQHQSASIGQLPARSIRARARFKPFDWCDSHTHI